MNKADINRALKGDIEVAVYVTGYGARIPTDVFGYASDRQRVVRCQVVALDQHTVTPGRFGGPESLSAKADGIRVRPLTELPTGPGFGAAGSELGVRPAHPEFNEAEGARYDEDTNERIVTSRHIIGPWEQFEARLNAFAEREAADAARREAESLARRAALDAAADVAAKLEGFGFPVSCEINRPGAVVMSVEIAERIAATLSAACALTTAIDLGSEALSEAVVKFGLTLTDPLPGEAA